MKLTTATLAFALTTILLASCKEDDYTSSPPLFSGLEVRSLTTGSDQIHEGERFVAEAVQSQRGQLIYRAKYVWSVNGQDEKAISHASGLSEAVYDVNPVNPTDTIRITKSGTYVISFSASYWGSGNESVLKGTPTVGTYSMSLLRMDYSGLTRTITVLPKESN